MTITQAPEPVRRGGALFGLVTGLLLGALVAALVLPKRSTVEAGAAAGPGARPGLEATAGAAGAPDAAGAATAAPGAAGSGVSGGGGADAGAAASTAGTVGTAGPGAGSAPAAGSGPVTPAPVATSSVRGVSPTTITIGIAYPDISALRALGPEYDNGDVPGQWKALLDGWKRSGQLPIAGRTIELQFASYNVLDQNQQRSACASLVSDAHAFAVIGVEYFEVGADCVAHEFRTPLLTSDGPGDAAFARGAPFLFSLSMSDSRMLRNWLHWADRRGALRGHRLGLYWLTDGPTTAAINDTVKPELAKMGLTLAAEATTDQQLGGPGDALAVQKFRAAGVDVALIFGSKGGFMQQADAQAYHPTYLDNDHDYGTSDTATSTYPSDQFDGTFGITGRRAGEAAAGIGMTAAQEACIGNYERWSGRKVARPGGGGHETAEYAYNLTACDLGNVLLTALRAAGPSLTPASFVAGLETISEAPMLRYPNVTFTRDRHDGVHSQRTVQWHASCTCWRAIGGFAPLVAS